MKKRCAWVSDDELYRSYHDLEWGVPVHEDSKHLEFLILDGMQAGLSWLTILRKRENFRRAFDDFNPEAIAGYPQEKINSLLQDAGIIRNKSKINAAITNAVRLLEVKKEFDSFDAYIWSFVEGRTIQNSWQRIDDIPAKTPESERMSRDLVKRGFKYVGPIICYAYMQAAGLVNDHTIECFRYRELNP